MSGIVTITNGKMILGIDDCRELRQCNVVCRDYFSAVAILNTSIPWHEIYLDHDLQSWADHKEYTGYDVICHIESMVEYGDMILPDKIVCVSDNASGRARIEQVIDKLYKRGQFA